MARLQTTKKSAAALLKPKASPKANSGPREKINANSGRDKGRGRQQDSPVKGKYSGKGENDDNLKEEILALGGDEEDYKLVKDIDSDEEVNPPSSSKADAALSRDVAKLMKELKFSSTKPPEANDDEDAEESDEGEGSGEEESPATFEETEKTIQKNGGRQAIAIPEVGPNAQLLFEPTPQWYTSLASLAPSKKAAGPPAPEKFTALQSRAAALHAAELTAYESATGSNKLTASSAEAAFLQRVLSSGTLSDRLSALTLMAQSSPVHNTRALETLRAMGQKKGREESLKALRAVADWWVGGGAPDRKLKYFIDQPLTHPGVTDKHLLVWYFEDWLKKYFYGILQILEALSLDPLHYVRLQTMSLIFTLLRDKAEQEQNLLKLLVNKLGDSERPVASRASYHILRLIQAHPQMKAVVVREMTALVLRPIGNSNAAASSTQTGGTHLKWPVEAKPKAKSQTGKQKEKPEKKDLQQEHAKYYAAITLNQIMLTPTESDRAVAVQLINLYFELFKEILGQPEKPEGSIGGEHAEDEMDHTRFGKEKRKRQEQKSGKGKDKEEHDGGFAEVEDSNSKFISAILTGVNRALPFAKLGLENVQFSKHIDTLFLISHKSTFNISLQALRLIMQICQSLASTSAQSTSTASLSTSITDRYYRTLYTSLHDPRLNSSSKQAMYLNLLLKSLKIDRKKERVKAFVRRFVQLLAGGANGGVEFLAGGLFLLGELFSTEPGLRDMLDVKRPNISKEPEDGGSEGNLYDPRKRDPQYANASASPLWELIPLLSHYHPTVQLHASQLLSGRHLTASADLSLNTLSHFLDRFVYKNPKKVMPKGSSAMQPAASAPDGTNVRVAKGDNIGGEVTMNDEAFWTKNVKNVPVDQVFFHKYFSQKNEKVKAKADKVAKRKGVADDSDKGKSEQDDEIDAKESIDDADSVNDESADEAEIWEAIKATNPDLRGDLDDISENDSHDSENDRSEEDDDSSKDGSAEDEDENGLSLAEDSDADDLVDLDDDIPDRLIDYESGASTDEERGVEWGGFGGEVAKKRKRGERPGDEKQKKKKLRSLPTFATYEDYAKMIEDGPEDDI